MKCQVLNDKCGVVSPVLSVLGAGAVSPDYDEDMLELAPDVGDERQGPRLLGGGGVQN